MKTIVLALITCFLLIGCKGKEGEKEEKNLDLEEMLEDTDDMGIYSEQTGIDSLDKYMADFNEKLRQLQAESEKAAEEAKNKPRNSRTDEEDYLKWAIEQGNLTINSPADDIPMNFEFVGTLNLREHLELDAPSYLEDVLDGAVFRNYQDAKAARRRLGLAKPEQMDSVLLGFLQIPAKELNMIKTIPGTGLISNEIQARNVRDHEFSSEIKAHLNSGKATEAFQTMIADFNKKKNLKSQAFLINAERARKAFYEENPGWYGDGGEIGNTYIDARKKFIYLPFGDLSFADRIVEHRLGDPEGGFTEGALGAPDMSLESFTIADQRICYLGVNGVLTLSFEDNSLTDVNGPDLYVFELGKIEPTRLEISKDGTEWIEVGKIEGGTAMVDISHAVQPGETFNYIRLTDLETYSTVPGADVDAVAAIGGALRLNLDSSVLFDTGKHELKEEASGSLEELLEAIREIPKGMIIVEGHTDNVGDPNSNQSLSERRAATVSSYLKEHLIGSYTYETRGFGESRPLADNTSEEGRQTNRRVEILVVPTNQ